MTQIMFPWRRFKIIEATHWMTVNTKPTAASNNTDYNFRACQCVSVKLPVNLKPTIENSLKEWKKIKPFVPRFHQAISRDVAVATIRGGHVTEWRCVVNRRGSNTLLSNRRAQTDLQLLTAKFPAHYGNIQEDANRRGHTRRNVHIVTSLFGKPASTKTFWTLAPTGKKSEHTNFTR